MKYLHVTFGLLLSLFGRDALKCHRGHQLMGDPYAYQDFTGIGTGKSLGACTKTQVIYATHPGSPNGLAGFLPTFLWVGNDRGPVCQVEEHGSDSYVVCFCGTDFCNERFPYNLKAIIRPTPPKVPCEGQKFGFSPCLGVCAWRFMYPERQWGRGCLETDGPVGDTTYYGLVNYYDGGYGRGPYRLLRFQQIWLTPKHPLYRK